MLRGVPDILMMRNNRAQRIDKSVLPSPDLAVQMYTNAGGNLTDPDSFGNDPISTLPNKVDLRKTAFVEKFSSFGDIFHELVNGDSSKFKTGLLYYIDITKRLAASQQFIINVATSTSCQQPAIANHKQMRSTNQRITTMHMQYYSQEA